MDNSLLQASLKARLVSSGEYTKLLKTLESKLKDSNWQSTIETQAKQIATTQAGLEKVTNGVESNALGLYFLELYEWRARIDEGNTDSVPTEIRSEIEALIKAFVEKNVE